MRVKLISTTSKIVGWEGFNDRLKLLKNFTINNNYEVIFIDEIMGTFKDNLGVVIFSNNYLEEQKKVVRYMVIDDDGEPNFIPRDCFEIVDRIIPDFWVEQDYYEYKILAPKGWDGTSFSDYEDGNIEVRERFYKEYQELYKQPIRLAKKSKIFSQSSGLDIVCESKRIFLKPTDKELEFTFITEEDNFYDENEFGLTIGKKYHCFEIKNNFWYKVKNDNGYEYFYPGQIFETIENENWHRYSSPYLTEKQIKKIMINKTL